MPASKTPLDDDEEELSLPPLDGALGDAPAFAEDESDIETFDNDGARFGDDAPASFDSSFEIDAIEEHAPQETKTPLALDIGALIDDAALPDERVGPDDERVPFYDVEEPSPFDAVFNADVGNGTGEDPSDFIDESALPPLASVEEDAEGAPHGAAVSSEKTLENGLNFPWNRSAWRVCPGVGATVPCWLVAVSPPRDPHPSPFARIIAAGPTILIVRDDARVSKRGPDIDAVALATNASVLFVVARSGGLFASLDAGESWFSVQDEPISTKRPFSIAVTPGKLWVCENGALWHAHDAEKTGLDTKIEVCREGAYAITETASTLVLLRDRGSDLVIERSRADDEASACEVVPPVIQESLSAQIPSIAAAAAGRLLSLIAPPRLHISRDAGRSFVTFRVGATLGFTFAGDATHASWLALVEPHHPEGPASDHLQNPPRDERSPRPGQHLLLLEGTASGDIFTVAEIKTAAPFGRAALAWDSSREVIWIATPAGLIGLERAPRH